MARHWGIALAVLTLAVGSALAAGAASASSVPRTALAHVYPGRPMIAVGAPGAVGRPAASSETRNVVASSNWSGYALHGGRYRNISATWIEPKATCTTARPKYAAFWVGLDGYLPSSTSVEQIGTDSDCVGKTPHYYGWYEMFPLAPVNFKTQVRPGNKMSASVTFSGTDTYTLVLQNVTRGWTHTIVKHETGLARSSAEVITEAPSSGATGAVLPLADFGTILYSSCRVSGISLRKLSPTRIVMVDGSGLAKDSTSLIGTANQFHNTWIRST
jgi:Peptidase A4 family